MPANLLVSGPPRIGKTTVVERVRDRLDAEGYRAGGVYCPDVRRDGDRVGFEIVDVATGESRTLAHVDRERGPSVGKYRVNVAGVDELCSAAFSRAFEDADYLVVDEIAPMERYSDAFVREVRRALDSDLPLVAAVHQGSEGFVGEVKARDDADVFEVTVETRDDLPAELVERVKAADASLDA